MKRKKIIVTLIVIFLLILSGWYYLFVVLSTSQSVDISKSIEISYHVRDNAFAGTDGSFYKEIEIDNSQKEIGISMESPSETIKIYLVTMNDGSEIIAIEDNFVCTYIYYLETLEEVDLNFSCDVPFETINAENNLGKIEKKMLLNRETHKIMNNPTSN